MTDIAIACQGGGSHTAFTAGVLKRLLADERPTITALSGTSGGAVCAFLAWYGMVSGRADRGAGLLDAFWSDVSASAPGDSALNASLVAASRLEGAVTLPTVSPYWFPPWAQEGFRRQLQDLVPDQELDRLVPETRSANGGRRPLLLLGAVDVVNGEFLVFSSEGAMPPKHHRLTLDSILASAAIPTLFRAVHVNGAVCWDGLFSQNPPIRDLPDEPADRPAEIWIIQINPKARGSEPKSASEILDRRNELSGNLSLYQEIGSIEKMNELIRMGAFIPKLMAKYQPVKVRFIEMDPAFGGSLDTASKLDRRPGFIRSLMEHGEEQADEFLAAPATATA